MKVLIVGICHEIFFFGKKGQKLGCVLYTGAHYTRVNTVNRMRRMVSFELGKEIEKGVFRLVTSVGQRKTK